MNSKLIDIIIPHYGDKSLLERCLLSIRKYTPQDLYNLIIIDNNQDNRGFSKAINEGVRQSNHPYLVFLNNDVELSPDWHTRLLKAFQLRESIAAVGPLSSASKQWQSVHNISLLLNQDLPQDRIITAKDVGFEIWLAFWCVMIKRSYFEEIGLLDETFFMYAEDEDWCARAKQRGFEIALDVGQVIYHQHRTNFNEDVKKEHDLSRAILKERWGNFIKKQWGIAKLF